MKITRFRSCLSPAVFMRNCSTEIDGDTAMLDARCWGNRCHCATLRYKLVRVRQIKHVGASSQYFMREDPDRSWSSRRDDQFSFNAASQHHGARPESGKHTEFRWVSMRSSRITTALRAMPTRLLQQAAALSPQPVPKSRRPDAAC